MIAVGGRHFNLTSLRNEEIQAVVDLNDSADERARATEVGIEYYGVYIEDFSAPTQRQLDLVVQILGDLAARKRKVLVHCTGGIGRSPTCVAAYLIKQGLTVDDAVRLIQKRRQVAWNHEPGDVRARQIETLRAFERRCRRSDITVKPEVKL